MKLQFIWVFNTIVRKKISILQYFFFATHALRTLSFLPFSFLSYPSPILPGSIGAGKFLCSRSNLLKTVEAMSDESQVHLTSLINCKILVPLSQDCLFQKRSSILISNYFSWTFSSLTGRTLDTTEGKPGSLRQTAEEVNSFACVDIVGHPSFFFLCII